MMCGQQLHQHRDEIAMSMDYVRTNLVRICSARRRGRRRTGDVRQATFILQAHLRECDSEQNCDLEQNLQLETESATWNRIYSAKRGNLRHMFSRWSSISRSTIVGMHTARILNSALTDHTTLINPPCVMHRTSVWPIWESVFVSLSIVRLSVASAWLDGNLELSTLGIAVSQQRDLDRS